MLFITKVFDNGHVSVKDTSDNVEEVISVQDLQKLDKSNIKVYGYSARGRLQRFEDESSVLKYYTAQSKLQGYSFKLDVVKSGLALVEGVISNELFKVPQYITEVGTDFGVDPGYFGNRGIRLCCKQLVGSRFLKSIGDSACSFSESLISVCLPDVTYISEKAFESCINLEDVLLCNRLSKLDVRVFSRCYSLKSINLPDSIRIIKDACFAECRSLCSITLPKSLRALGYKVFKDSSLGVVDMSKCEDLTYISSCSLADCSINTLILPPNLRLVDRTAFMGCAINEVRGYNKDSSIPIELFPKSTKLV